MRAEMLILWKMLFTLLKSTLQVRLPTAKADAALTQLRRTLKPDAQASTYLDVGGRSGG